MKGKTMLPMTTKFTRRQFLKSAAQAGALLANAWNLDTALVQAIEQHHHRGSPAAPSVAAATAAANNFCKQCQIGESGDAVVEELPDDVIRRFGTPEEISGRLAAVIPDEINRAAAFLCPNREQAMQ